MNPLFSGDRRKNSAACSVPVRAVMLVGFVILCVCPLALKLRGQTERDGTAEFKRISQLLSEARLGGGNENEAEMGKALAYLDSTALSVLNGQGEANLEGTNRGLAELVSRTPPIGENYRLVKIGGAPSVYAMVINFGLGGPAAVRIYAGGAGHYALAGRIDHFAQKDFLDSDVELVPASKTETVFVTVSGRTDDLSTGAFSAWQFDGHRVTALWNSDLLQQSSYEADENGFHLAYCSQVDDDHPSQCLKMSRDLYRFQAGEWKRLETADLPTPKSPATPALF